MKENKSIQINYNKYSLSREMNEADQALIQKAIEFSKTAYAPYSKFKVGSAVLLENGNMIAGSNQENAAYPSGLCAERVTLFSASANFPNLKMLAIAIYTDSETTAKKQISPCGSCRQVMSEYEVKQGDNLRVLLVNSSKEVWEFNSSSDLLPLAFDYNALKKE